MTVSAAEAVTEAIAWVYELPRESLQPETRLDDFGADSVGLIVVADRVEAAGWVISDLALKNATTIFDLIESAEWHNISNQI